MAHHQWPSCCLARLGSALVLVAFSVSGARLAAATPDFSHYYYFKEERALALDSTRLAILDPEFPSSDRVGDFLRQAGYQAPELVPHPIRGWSLFQLSEASGPPELSGSGAVSDTIARLVSLDPPPHLFFAPVFRGDSGPSFPTGTILVRFDDGLGDAEIVGVLNQLGMGRMERRPLGSMRNAFVIATGFRSGISALELANRLALRPEVVAAEVDMVFGGRSAHIPNDPNFSGSWGLHNVGQSGGTPDVDIDAPEAWDRTLGSPSILTMILDTGVQQDHPDLHQLPGIDLTGEGTSGEPVNSCDNHGTAVAGILGSTIDNGLGTAGAAPGAWIVSARTFISEVPCTGKWTTDTLWTVDALDWAISAGVRVTNNSNFYGFESSLIASKYQETRDVWGMTHFASAGNSAIQHIEYPAALPTVHAITAIDSTGTRASFSSWGPETSFTGPGEDLFTTDRTGAAGFTSGDYAPLVWGTSFSCPMAACVAALLLSEAYSLDPDEVDELLRSSAVDLGTPGWDQFFGWGLPNAAGALQALDLFFDDFESGNAAKWSASKP